jgi:hypothetical protein
MVTGTGHKGSLSKAPAAVRAAKSGISAMVCIFIASQK